MGMLLSLDCSIEYDVFHYHIFHKSIEMGVHSDSRDNTIKGIH